MCPLQTRARTHTRARTRTLPPLPPASSWAVAARRLLGSGGAIAVCRRRHAGSTRIAAGHGSVPRDGDEPLCEIDTYATW